MAAEHFLHRIRLQQLHFPNGFPCYCNSERRNEQKPKSRRLVTSPTDGTATGTVTQLAASYTKGDELRSMKKFSPARDVFRIALITEGLD